MAKASSCHCFGSMLLLVVVGAFVQRSLQQFPSGCFVDDSLCDTEACPLVGGFNCIDPVDCCCKCTSTITGSSVLTPCFGDQSRDNSALGYTTGAQGLSSIDSTDIDSSLSCNGEFLLFRRSQNPSEDLLQMWRLISGTGNYGDVFTLLKSTVSRAYRGVVSCDGQYAAAIIANGVTVGVSQVQIRTWRNTGPNDWVVVGTTNWYTYAAAGTSVDFSLVLSADGLYLAAGSVQQGRVSQFNRATTLVAFSFINDIAPPFFVTPGRWGHSLALSTDRSHLFIGDPDAVNTLTNNVGVVQIFFDNANNGFFPSIGTILSPDATDLDFGYAVATNCDGSRLLVGVPLAPTACCPASSPAKGVARYYTVSATTPTFVQELQNANSAASNRGWYGRDVGMSCDGDRIIVVAGANNGLGDRWSYNSGTGMYTSRTATITDENNRGAISCDASVIVYHGILSETDYRKADSGNISRSDPPLCACNGDACSEGGTSDCVCINPTPAPTPNPTPNPTPSPTPEPTSEPTTEPTSEPTTEPTSEPTTEPTSEPSPEPTPVPCGGCIQPDICTLSECNLDAKLCEETRIWGCCLSNASIEHCYHPGGVCVEKYCSGTNECELYPIGNCCASDEDCRGGNLCSEAYCEVETGTCRSLTVEKVCPLHTVDMSECYHFECNSTTGACDTAVREPMRIKCPGACCQSATATCTQVPLEACVLAGGTWLDSNVECSLQVCGFTLEPTGEPTIEPTGEPTIEPTGEPTIEPTTEPTGEPTKEPTGEPTKEPTGEPTGEPTPIPPTPLPTPAPTTVTFVQSPAFAGCPADFIVESTAGPPFNVWDSLLVGAERDASSLGPTNVCASENPKLNYDDHATRCNYAGARTCSFQDLRRGEGRGSGCNFDGQTCWGQANSLICPTAGTAPGTSCQRVVFAQNSISCQAQSVSTTWVTSCCCDVEAFCPEDFSCVTRGSPTTCGGTNEASLGGLCSGLITHAAAVSFCATARTRLCTMAELINEEPAGTGCGYDNDPVWALVDVGVGANQCPQGQAPTYDMGATAVACVNLGATAVARCCCDKPSAVPAQQLFSEAALNTPGDTLSGFACMDGRVDRIEVYVTENPAAALNPPYTRAEYFAGYFETWVDRPDQLATAACSDATHCTSGTCQVGFSIDMNELDVGIGGGTRRIYLYARRPGLQPLPFSGNPILFTFP